MNNELFLNRRMLVLRSVLFRGEERRNKFDENLSRRVRIFTFRLDRKFQLIYIYIFAKRCRFSIDDINIGINNIDQINEYSIVFKEIKCSRSCNFLGLKVLWINENRIERSFENRLIKSRRSIPSIFPPNKFCRRKWTDRISKRLCHVRNTALSNVGNDFTNRIDSRIQRTAMSASNVSSALDSWAKPVFCDLWSLELPSPSSL